MLVSVKYDFFFDSLKLIKVYSHPLIFPLLGPKVSAKKIHYRGKILGESNFVDLVS